MDTIPPVLQPTENKMTLHDILSLQTVTLSDCVEFIPPVQFGKVVKVYDGDTITVACYLQFVHDEKATCYKFSVRLNGIDTPEIKGKTLGERELAKKARDALSDLIFGKIVELRNVSLEKYGRLLADVYINGLHVNGWMIEKGFAVKYDGGTKTGFGIEE
jgi:endonuclease YncB( thermonuclease family)